MPVSKELVGESLDLVGHNAETQHLNNKHPESPRTVKPTSPCTYEGALGPSSPYIRLTMREVAVTISEQSKRCWETRLLLPLTYKTGLQLN